MEVVLIKMLLMVALVVVEVDMEKVERIHLQKVLEYKQQIVQFQQIVELMVLDLMVVMEEIVQKDLVVVEEELVLLVLMLHLEQ